MSSTIYRTLAGAFTALCVLAQYWLSVHGETLGQAARISGVTPAAISILMVHLKRESLRGPALRE